jgi:hypothetical protein
LFLLTRYHHQQNRTDNFAHPAPIDLCKQFYYNSADSLAFLFPDEFRTLPKTCLAMACTCVGFLLLFFARGLTSLQLINCVQEWQHGEFTGTNFCAEQYASVYDGIMYLIDQTLEDEYHGPKLRQLL